MAGKPETFGQYITMARQHKGMSGRQLAKSVGVANTTIMDIEAGSIPSPGLFLNLIDGLDLDILTAVQLVEPYRRIYERIIQAQKGAG